MKEMIFFEMTAGSDYCHLEWFVLSAEFATHTARAEGWILDHVTVRWRERRGYRASSVGLAMGSGKGEFLDENSVLKVQLSVKPSP